MTNEEQNARKGGGMQSAVFDVGLRLQATNGDMAVTW
jgi:hypothetical protein